MESVIIFNWFALKLCYSRMISAIGKLKYVSVSFSKNIAENYVQFNKSIFTLGLTE